MSEKKDNRNVYQRISAVANEIESFAKDGENRQFNFRYASIEKIIHELRPLCYKHGLAIVQGAELLNVREFQGDRGVRYITEVVVTTTAINLDDPEDRHVVKTPGHGFDTLDKGVYKAISGARKYAIYGLFCLHAGDDDPEYDGNIPPEQSSAGRAGHNDARRSTRGRQTRNKPASDGIGNLRRTLFPGLESWPPKNRDGFDINIPPWNNPYNMKRDGSPSKAPNRLKGLASECGFGTDERRHSLFRALYRAFGYTGPIHTSEMTAGHGRFFENCLEHPNIILISEDDPIPWERDSEVPEPPPAADDPRLDPDLDLEEDEDFFDD